MQRKSRDDIWPASRAIQKGFAPMLPQQTHTSSCKSKVVLDKARDCEPSLMTDPTLEAEASAARSGARSASPAAPCAGGCEVGSALLSSRFSGGGGAFSLG